MAEWAPNLDDGELYLPSDIFPDEDEDHRFRRPYSSSFGRSRSLPSTSTLVCVDDLAKKLSAFGLIDPNNHQAFPINAVQQGFMPEPGHGVVIGGRQPPLGYGEYVPPVAHRGGGGYGGGFRPVCPPNPGKLAPPQPQVYGKPSFMQRQQNHGQCRFFPPRMSSSGSGTGVFLPRIINNNAAKKPGMKRREEQEKQQQQQPMRIAALGRKQGMAFHVPTEKGLPQDWTY